MASPAIALPNGVTAPMQFSNHSSNSNNNNTADVDVNVNVNSNANSPDTGADSDVNTAQSIASSSIKRKRESSDVSEKPPNGLAIDRITPTATDGTSLPSATKVDQPTIRNYYEVLQRYIIFLCPLPSAVVNILSESYAHFPSTISSSTRNT